MKNKEIRAITLLIPLTLGTFNKEEENISVIYAKAIDTVSERNKIHPKVTKAKVTDIFNKRGVCCLFPFNSNKQINNNP